ncbi:laccase domain-containing protein, partial [Salmonella enterica]|nr:laccase domain-containing protein [Salmonella enterica]
TITEALPSPRPQADAMVTNVPGLILGALSADCGPVLFCEPIMPVGAVRLPVFWKTPWKPWLIWAVKGQKSAQFWGRALVRTIMKSALNS